MSVMRYFSGPFIWAHDVRGPADIGRKWDRKVWKHSNFHSVPALRCATRSSLSRSHWCLPTKSYDRYRSSRSRNGHAQAFYTCNYVTLTLSSSTSRGEMCVWRWRRRRRLQNTAYSPISGADEYDAIHTHKIHNTIVIRACVLRAWLA